MRAFGDMNRTYVAKFRIGQVVRHRMNSVRGVIFDVDPEFANSDEWYRAIPIETRPRKDQPFYHLLAESDDSHYVAYVSEQNLQLDSSNDPVQHPEIDGLFERDGDGRYQQRSKALN
jgi:heat shock protein HspQ